MKHLALIDQARGLGDIFFLQKAATLISERVDNIIWPIHPKYNYLHQYLKTPKVSYFSFPIKESDFSESVKIWHKVLYDNFKYNNFKSVILGKNVIHYIPFRTSMSMLNVNSDQVMYSKYKIINTNFSDWKNYFKFVRNPEREDELRKRYGIEKGEKFVFVNTMYYTNGHRTYDIKPETDYKIVYNDSSLCHIFDFCWILENAQEIHTVETSICYLVESLNTTDRIFCYPRKKLNGDNEYPNYDYINKLFSKKWNYIK